MLRAKPNHPAAMTAARTEPGRWVLAGIYPSPASARSTARRIPRAERVPSYEPAGAFEAYAARHDDGTAVWVRYIAGETPVPELPDTMSVRVCDRGDGPGYRGVCIVTVTISTRCPRCGGPRGFATVRPHRFHEDGDGDWYVVDRWDNPCGHIDMHENVLREARTALPVDVAAALSDAGDADPAADAGEFATAVTLLYAAAAESPGLHAKQAAQLLAHAGESRAAEFIFAELTARRGHMSAKQAAQFLIELAVDRTCRKDSK